MVSTMEFFNKFLELLAVLVPIAVVLLLVIGVATLLVQIATRKPITLNRSGETVSRWAFRYAFLMVFLTAVFMIGHDKWGSGVRGDMGFTLFVIAVIPLGILMLMKPKEPKRAKI